VPISATPSPFLVPNGATIDSATAPSHGAVTCVGSEIRAEILAQFQVAFPEYRLLKVVPAPGQARPGRRQTVRNQPNATLIGTANERELTNLTLSDDE
jgi:hypothetical protein